MIKELGRWLWTVVYGSAVRFDVFRLTDDIRGMLVEY